MKPIPTIAVDFDGTCVTHEYPNIGRDIGAAPVLRDLAASGHRLILWTMRSGDRLAEAVTWFADNGIPLFGVNFNPEQASWTQSPKVYSQLYIDDAAMGAPLIAGLAGERPHLDWAAVRRQLLPSPLPPIDLTALNPGIRHTVQWLRERGFDTRDSGDGKTREFECDLTCPYVHIHVPPANLVSETDRLVGLLEDLGVKFSPMEDESDCDSPQVEACYLPVHGSGWIHLFNVVIPEA